MTPATSMALVMTLVFAIARLAPVGRSADAQEPEAKPLTRAEEPCAREFVKQLDLGSAYAISRKERSLLAALSELNSMFGDLKGRHCFTRFAPDFELVLFCERGR